MAVLVIVVACALAGHAPARASEALWSLLKGGGQVVLIRHTITTPGVGDPPGMRLDTCSTQRNLSEQGRSDARTIGAAFRARAIPVDQALASPWCRCVDTAELAFGAAPETWAPLGNVFGRPEARDAQVGPLRARLGTLRKGGNLVLVTHGSTIVAATGVSPDFGELVVVTPQGGTFSVAGRFSVH